MTWDAIGAIAEIVGAAGVIASLVYLAVQIRHNSRGVEEQVRALRVQSYDSAGADFSALRLHISSSPQLASVWRRAKESYVSLEPDERAQANELLTELLWAYQNILSRMEHGADDDVLEQLVAVNIAYWFKNAGFREWWATEENTPYTNEFEELMDRVCQELDDEARGAQDGGHSDAV